jgi:signal transduction histidine kinase/sensor domain CHASE-containing protein
MKLKTKISIVTVSTAALMFLATNVGSYFILEKSYLKLENDQALTHVNRGLQALDQMLESVASNAKANAVWDDAYQFVTDKNQAFIDGNLQLSSLEGFGVNMQLFFNTEGKPVYYAITDLNNTKLIEPPPGLEKYLEPKGKLVHQPDVESKIQGLIDMPMAMVLIAARSIVKGDNSGPVHGTLIAAKYFTNSDLEKLKEVTKLDINIYRKNSLDSNKNIKNIYNNLLKNNKPLIINDKKVLHGYALLKDINNQPFAVLEISAPRSIHQIGLAAITFFNSSFLIYIALFVIILISLLKTLITNRLEGLNKHVINIGETRNFSSQIKEEGNDELTSVEVEINKMLKVIQDYNNEQAELLKKVADSEHLVTNIINAMPSILVITDENLNIKRVNSLAEKTLFNPVKHFLELPIYQVFPFLESYINDFTIALQKDSSQLINKIAYNNHGTIHYFDCVIYPLKSGNKKYIATRIDEITAKIKLEEKVAQNDKLASIGVLTAGVAHEINNPINFVSSNIQPLKRDIEDVQNILKQFLSLKTVSDFESKIADINAAIQDLDLNYTLEEINKLLLGIKEGAERTATIVKDLKSFTRLDEDTMKKSNIHEGIDSTLTLLQHNYRDRIKIIKNYGKIPEIDCFPGRLNQVFMNLISNAIDAIPGNGEITISTKQEDKKVIITISDNGTGIKEENLARIFEPFYTTKGVGKGTGLGLSIAFGILQSHSGTIDVTSKTDKGTTFTITLPIDEVKQK